jgi:hypothetical protein
MNPTRRVVDFILGSIALIGLLLSLAVHLSALLHWGPPAQMGSYVFLHLGIFVVFVPMVFLMRWEAGSGRMGLAQWRAMFPGWVFVLLVAVMVYTAVNFVLFMLGTEGGSAALRDGHYVLSDHGRVVREITQAEYLGFEANLVRGFSGHWLAFYFAAAAYYLLRKPRGNAVLGASYGA